MEFNGTLFVNSNEGKKIVGLVFGFQNAKWFYVISWNQATQRYSNAKGFSVTAEAGLVIKVTERTVLRFWNV